MISYVDRSGRIFITYDSHDFHVLTAERAKYTLVGNYFTFFLDECNETMPSIDILRAALNVALLEYPCDQVFNETALCLSVEFDAGNHHIEYVYLDDKRNFRNSLGTIYTHDALIYFAPSYTAWNRVLFSKAANPYTFNLTSISRFNVNYLKIMLDKLIVLRDGWLA